MIVENPTKHERQSLFMLFESVCSAKDCCAKPAADWTLKSADITLK